MTVILNTAGIWGRTSTGRADFGKPGLRYHPEIQHRTCRPFPASIHVSGGQLYIRLIFPPEASEQYGCPQGGPGSIQVHRREYPSGAVLEG